MRQFLELSEAAEVKINKIYFKLNFHFCIYHPDTHHSPPEKHLSFYQGDIRLTKKHAEILRNMATKYEIRRNMATRLKARPSPARPVMWTANVGQMLSYPTRLTAPSVS